MEYNLADVLIHTREPFNKNTFWIQPTKSEIKFNIYDNGKWKTIYTTKDQGLSSVSLQLVYEIVSILKGHVKDKFDRLNSSFIITNTKLKDLERRIIELESQVEKLSSYSSLLAKKLLKKHGE